MVELHYADEAIVLDAEGAERIEARHWRIVVSDADAAVAQAAQDIAEGRNPIAVVAADEPSKPKWDIRKKYRPDEWDVLVDTRALRRRAEAVGPAF